MEILNRPSRPLKRSNPPMVQRSFGGTNETMNEDSSVSKVLEINPFDPARTYKTIKVDPQRIQQLINIVQS